MVSSILGIQKWNTIGLNEAAEYYNEKTFAALVKSDNCWEIPTKSDVDAAFEMTKATPHSQLIHFRLSDLCNAYLKLHTEIGCQKAFEVVEFKCPDYEPGTVILTPIVDICLKLKTLKTIILARKIFDRYPNLMKYSFENYRSLVSLEEQFVKTHEYTNELEKPQAKKSKQSTMTPIRAKTIETVQTSISYYVKTETIPAEVSEKAQQIFNNIQLGETEHLKQFLDNLSVEEKTKLFSSTMEFDTLWARGKEEMTPLQYCCHVNNFGALKVLIESGANINDFNTTSASTERSSLHFAIDADASEIALFLISRGAQDKLASCHLTYGLKAYDLPNEYDLPNVYDGRSFSKHTCLSALHMATIKNMGIVVKGLLQIGKADIMEKASGINTVLHLAARNKNREIYDLLLAHGGHKLTEIKNHLNMTPKEYFLKESKF